MPYGMAAAPIISFIWNELKKSGINPSGNLNANQLRSVLGDKVTDANINKFLQYRRKEMGKSDLTRFGNNAVEATSFDELSHGQKELYDSTVDLIKKLKRADRRDLARTLENEK